MTQIPPHVDRTSKVSVRWLAELIGRLAVHRVGLRYRETVFGFGWIFLQPVALTIIFTYIFHRFAHVPSTVPYPLFAATGLVAWSLTSLVVAQSVISLTSQAALLRRVALPRVVLPVSVVLAALADLAVMSVMLVGLSVYYHHGFSLAALWAFPLLALHVALLIGVSCLVALATVFLRDITHAIPSLLQLWFFASPVFYPVAMVPAAFRMVAQWNPMTGLIEGYRAALLLGEPPPLEFVGPAVLGCLVIGVVGLVWFRRVEGTVVDFL